MIVELKTRLQELEEGGQDRLRVEIERRLGHPAPEAVASVRNLIHLTPSLMSQIRVWANDARLTPEDKRLSGYVLTYLFHENDLLPDNDQGLWGWVDDAYLVGRVYERTMNLFHFTDRRMLEHLKHAGPEVLKGLETIRAVIPSEAGRLESLLDELAQGRNQSFNRLVAGIN